MYSFLKNSNLVIRKIITIIIILSLGFSAFVIWDNYQYCQNVSNLQIDLLEKKPTPDSKLGFDELRKINPDVIGWITITGTEIDYPILQSTNNTYYLNRDVYKKFSMAGSIFMDYRCNKDFTDFYSIIYGHNMVNHLMFGDLMLYKNKDFFKNNTNANILIPDDSLDYKALAVLKINDSVKEVFEPEMWKDGLSGFAEFIKKNSMFFSQEQLNKIINNPKGMQVVSLVTCTEGSTGERLILMICRAKDNIIDNDNDDSEIENEDDVIENNNNDIETDKKEINPHTGNKAYSKIIVLIILISGCIIITVINKKRDKK